MITIEEDEIDLRELWKTIVKQKIFILFFTSIITILAIVWAYTRTPIYEVKSNVQIGFIGKDLIADSSTLLKILNLVFNVEDKTSIKTKKEFISEVSSITVNKKLINFIEIKTEAISNDEALKKNKEVVNYIENKYKNKIEQSKFNIDNQIKAIEIKIKTLEELEIKNIRREINRLKTQKITNINEKIKKIKLQDIANIKRQIRLLKTQKIVTIEKKINQIKSQDIKNIKRQIKLLETQKIVKIKENIKFYQTTKLNTLNLKIGFYTDKLEEYTKSVKQLYKDNKEAEDKTALTISSLQMVNYQNLILNSQNQIENLKMEIKKINDELIPNLKREMSNIKTVTIKDLELKIMNLKNLSIKNLQIEINNIKNITIKDLELKIVNLQNISIKNLTIEKKNLQDDTIRKLEYKLKVELPSKKINLLEKIEQLKNEKQNIQNSKVIGNYIIKDCPIKPKKKLIVIVSFITALILSIFIVFFLDFLKKEEN